jgi:hypothetical protein
MADHNSYWRDFEGPAAEISETVNNTYLKANAQSDGTCSYGRMVDLLLADTGPEGWNRRGVIPGETENLKGFQRKSKILRFSAF